MNRHLKQKKGGVGEKLRAFLHSAKALRLLICLLGATALILIFELAIVPVRYDLEVGMVSPYTIAATKDVVDEIGTEEARERAAAQVIPTYKFQEGVTEAVLSDFEQIFAQLRAVRQYGATLPNPGPTRVYDLEELQHAREMINLIQLRDYQIATLLRTSQEQLDLAHAHLYDAIQSVMQGHVTEGQEKKAAESIRQIVEFRTSVSLGQDIVPAVVSACIRPNMMIDHETTDAARQAARDRVEPVLYKQGQYIVVKGEGRITANQLAMLDSLGLLRAGHTDAAVYLGSALLVMLVLTGMCMVLRHPDYQIFQDTARLLLLFVTLIVSLSICVLARLLDSYLMPTALCAMLVTVLLGMKPGLIANVGLTVLAAALAAGGNESYSERMILIIITGLLSGTAAALVLQSRASRLRLLVGGVVGCGVDLLVCLALGLMTASDLSGALSNAALRVASTVFAMLLCIGIQPLLEMLFNLPTPMKLMELANPNQPLLRRLLLEAPGTYHHSTIVSNLAEAAAEAVGANPLLARVGGYYHDIGKLKRPLYFKENQLGDQNAHDHTNPEVSAAIVTSHTRDGLLMARMHRLPWAVQDIIANHHGDTPVMFFYHKALQMAGGKPVDINAYRYDGRPPKTKEGAIILLCDTIEAAVRTMKNPTPESIEAFIVKLVRGKLEDGQLSDSPLTLRDIDKICAAATTVLAGVFHERIEYPDVEELTRLQPSQRQEPQELPVPQEIQEEIMEEIPEADESQIDPPEPEALPLLELSVDELAPVVTPEVQPLAPVIAPPPAIGPVEIDTLVQIEPLPTKEQEMELLQAEGKAEQAAEQAVPAPDQVEMDEANEGGAVE